MQRIEPIILYCLNQLDGERTIYSIYHLLNGKKSSQTIQDAHLFSLKKFFGIYESLNRTSFEGIIQSMVEKQLIYPSDEQRYQLTPMGKSFLEKHPVPYYLNGWDYHPFTLLFWERLSLLIQVSSNLVFHESRYIPIQKNKDVHTWLKFMIKSIKISRSEIGNVIYSELLDCFNEEEQIDPSILVFRLTGFQQIGLTPLQTAQKLKIEIHDYNIEFVHILHYLIQKVHREAKRFIILATLILDLKQDDELTASARKTWTLLTQGYSIELIASQRGLKLSTIEDHLVEFALNINNFSIDDYVDKEMQAEIINISRQSASRQLKIIRKKINKASYFQIRLVLAKHGDR